MLKVISQCPVCKGQLKVVKMQCDTCDTVIENQFALTKFDYLSEEDLYFVESFIKCRGNIKEVEKEMGISYPTVRGKLDAVINKLGYTSESQDEEGAKRMRILEALEKGEITADEAIKELNN